LDFSNLYYVVHVEYPYTLLNFVQEVGRADRKRLGKAIFSLVITNDKAIRKRAADIARMATDWSGMQDRQLNVALVGLHRRALEYVQHGVAAEAGFPDQCLRVFVHDHAGLHGQVFPCVMRRGSTLCTTCLIWDESRRGMGLGGGEGAGGTVEAMQHDEGGGDGGGSGGGGERGRPAALQVAFPAPSLIPAGSSAGVGNRSSSSSGRHTVSGGLGTMDSSSSSPSFARAGNQRPAPLSLAVGGGGRSNLSASSLSSCRPGAPPGTTNVLRNATAASSSGPLSNPTATQLDPLTEAQRVRTAERRNAIVRVAKMYQTSLQDIGRRCGACLAYGEKERHAANKPFACNRLRGQCLRCHARGHGTQTCTWTRKDIIAAIGQGQGRREVRSSSHFQDFEIPDFLYIKTHTLKHNLQNRGKQRAAFPCATFASLGRATNSE
jgi:hypothetical protein